MQNDKGGFVAAPIKNINIDEMVDNGFKEIFRAKDRRQHTMKLGEHMYAQTAVRRVEDNIKLILKKHSVQPTMLIFEMWNPTLKQKTFSLSNFTNAGKLSFNEEKMRNIQAAQHISMMRKKFEAEANKEADFEVARSGRNARIEFQAGESLNQILTGKLSYAADGIEDADLNKSDNKELPSRTRSRQNSKPTFFLPQESTSRLGSRKPSASNYNQLNCQAVKPGILKPTTTILSHADPVDSNPLTRIPSPHELRKTNVDDFKTQLLLHDMQKDLSEAFHVVPSVSDRTIREVEEKKEKSVPKELSVGRNGEQKIGAFNSQAGSKAASRENSLVKSPEKKNELQNLHQLELNVTPNEAKAKNPPPVKFVNAMDVEFNLPEISSSHRHQSKKDYYARSKGNSQVRFPHLPTLSKSLESKSVGKDKGKLESSASGLDSIVGANSYHVKTHQPRHNISKHLVNSCKHGQASSTKAQSQYSKYQILTTGCNQSQSEFADNSCRNYSHRHPESRSILKDLSRAYLLPEDGDRKDALIKSEVLIQSCVSSVPESHIKLRSVLIEERAEELNESIARGEKYFRSKRRREELIKGNVKYLKAAITFRKNAIENGMFLI